MERVVSKTVYCLRSDCTSEPENMLESFVQTLPANVLNIRVGNEGRGTYLKQ